MESKGAKDQLMIWSNLVESGDVRYEYVVNNETMVLENKHVKVLWDFTIKTDKILDHNRPDITMIERKRKYVG